MEFGVFTAMYHPKHRREERPEQQMIREEISLIEAADKVASHEQKRADINAQITKQMKQQAELANEIIGGPSQPGNSVTGSEDQVLIRIAEAAETTAAAVGQWEIMSV